MVKEVHQCSSCGGFCKKSGCERAHINHCSHWKTGITNLSKEECPYCKIDELRAENAKLREGLKKQQALTDAGIRLCEIQQAKRPVLANVMEENARLRGALQLAKTMLQVGMPEYDAADVLEIVKAALGG